MDKRIATKYLAGTFFITYIMCGSIIAANQIGYLKYGTSISMILFAVGGNAPPIVSYVVLKKEHIITGFKQFAKYAFAVKQRPWNYALLIIFICLYFGVPALMEGISNGAKLYIAFLSIPLMTLFGGLEELGWRYILQPALERQLPFGIATSLTACVWAVWHAPLFFIAGTIQSGLSFELFFIMVFGMSFALAAIYYTSKSIWLCILFHSMINALSSSWVIQDSIVIKACTTLSMIALSFVVVIYHKKKSHHMKYNEYACELLNINN